MRPVNETTSPIPEEEIFLSDAQWNQVLKKYKINVGKSSKDPEWEANTESDSEDESLVDSDAEPMEESLDDAAASEGSIDVDGSDSEIASNPEDEPFEVPHRNPRFYFDLGRKHWPEYQDKDFIVERNIDVDMFKLYGIYDFLVNAGLVGSVTNLPAFVAEVVRNFMTNLSVETNNPLSAKYHTVFVHDQVYKFSPREIRKFLGIKRVSSLDCSNLGDEIASTLTAGNVTKWVNGLQVSRLTTVYAVLHKIAIKNWLPTRNDSVVTRPQADLLYQIGKGKKVDLGELIFDKIMESAEKVVKGLIPYPSIIYGVLVSQGFRKKSTMVFYKSFPPMGIHKDLLNPTKRVVDVEIVDLDSDTAADERDVKANVVTSNADSIYLDEIAFINSQMQVLARRKQVLEAKLSTQKGGESAHLKGESSGAADKGKGKVDETN